MRAEPGAAATGGGGDRMRKAPVAKGLRGLWVFGTLVLCLLLWWLLIPLALWASAKIAIPRRERAYRSEYN